MLCTTGHHRVHRPLYVLLTIVQCLLQVLGKRRCASAEQTPESVDASETDGDSEADSDSSENSDFFVPTDRVERILAQRQVNGKDEFRVKYKGEHGFMASQKREGFLCLPQAQDSTLARVIHKAEVTAVLASGPSCLHLSANLSAWQLRAQLDVWLGSTDANTQKTAPPSHML